MKFTLPDCFFAAEVSDCGYLTLETEDGQKIAIGFANGKRFEVLKKAIEECEKRDQK